MLCPWLKNSYRNTNKERKTTPVYNFWGHLINLVIYYAHFRPYIGDQTMTCVTWMMWVQWICIGFPKNCVHISCFVVFCCGLVPVEWTYLTNPTMHQVSHNAAFCNSNVHTCAHSCNKMVHCMIWDRCTVRFVRHIHLPISLRVTSLASIKKHGKANVWPW